MPVYGRTTLEPAPTWALPIIVDDVTQKAIFSPIWLRWFLDFGQYVASIATATGTVTSVAQTVPSFLSIAGSPITVAGTLAISYSGSPLPIANGGTGAVAFTAYAPLFGGITSTGAIQSGTVGTAGQVLMSNGAGAIATFQALPADVEPIAFIVTCSDETTALTTGLKVTFRMPFAMTLTDVRGGLTTAATGATLFAFDLKENGTSVFSTKPTFTASSKTTVGAVTPAVISDSALANESEMTIIVDAVGSTIAGVGLKVTLIGTKP